MKKLIVLTLLAWINVTALAQKKMEVKSEITSVTVYLTGAEINRQAAANISTGTTDVIFTNLPANLNQQTINVSADSKLIIQSIQYRMNYMQSPEMNIETKKWKDSLDVVNKLLAQVQDRKDVLTSETQLLEANQTVTGQNSGMNFETMKQYHDYYIQMMTQNKAKLLAEEETETKLNEIKQRLTKQLADYQAKQLQPKGEIWISVHSDNPLNAKFNLSYFVYTAGWSPEYDLRSESIKSNVKITYKARLWQSTNEDWRNVKLKLSSGNPTLGAVGPIFSTWYMDYYYGNTGGKRMEGLSLSNAPSVTEKMSKNEDISETSANYTSVSNTQFATEFDISIPSTIPSDGEPHLVSIQNYELASNYEYYTIPKFDYDVFLTAQISGWEKLNLLPGNANIFFEGSYVGQSYIDVNNTQDTLSIFLGRDKKIIVKREKVKDFTKKRVIGSIFKQTVAYDISIRNTKSEPVTVKIIDQYPISANSEIEVILEDAGGATVDAENGKLTWNPSLKPNSEQKFRYSFSVKFPEKKRVYAPLF